MREKKDKPQVITPTFLSNYTLEGENTIMPSKQRKTIMSWKENTTMPWKEKAIMHSMLEKAMGNLFNCTLKI